MTDIQYENTKQTPQTLTRDVWGMFQTTAVVPTGTPTNWAEQIVIYSSGATYKLYVFNVTTKTWMSVTIA